jgi:hypothetical protein
MLVKEIMILENFQLVLELEQVCILFQSKKFKSQNFAFHTTLQKVTKFSSQLNNLCRISESAAL